MGCENNSVNLWLMIVGTLALTGFPFYRVLFEGLNPEATFAVIQVLVITRFILVSLLLV